METTRSRRSQSRSSTPRGNRPLRRLVLHSRRRLRCPLICQLWPRPCRSSRLPSPHLYRQRSRRQHQRRNQRWYLRRHSQRRNAPKAVRASVTRLGCASTALQANTTTTSRSPATAVFGVQSASSRPTLARHTAMTATRASSRTQTERTAEHAKPASTPSMTHLVKIVLAANMLPQRRRAIA